MKTFLKNKKIAFNSTVLLLGFAFLVSSCAEEDIIKPAPETPVSHTTPPTLPSPPDPGTPRASTGKKVEVKLYGSTQTMEYNLGGLMTRYTSNSNHLFIHNFEYDDAKRLVKQTTNNWGTTRYVYIAGKLAKATQYDLLDRPSKEFVFTFNAANQLIETRKFNVDLGGNIHAMEKVTYEYEAQGNMTLMKQYYLNEATGQLEFQTAFHFENFDNKKNALPFWSAPYLPQVTFWVNNPGKKYVVNKNGEKLIGAEAYGYTYNTEGYPVERYTSVEVGKSSPLTYSGTINYTAN